MVDLGVPRNIESEVKDLPDIFLYTLDNIQDLVKKNYKTREKLHQTQKILLIPAFKII